MKRLQAGGGRRPSALHGSEHRRSGEASLIGAAPWKDPACPGRCRERTRRVGEDLDDRQPPGSRRAHERPLAVRLTVVQPQGSADARGPRRQAPRPRASARARCRGRASGSMRARFRSRRVPRAGWGESRSVQDSEFEVRGELMLTRRGEVPIGDTSVNENETLHWYQRTRLRPQATSPHTRAGEVLRLAATGIGANWTAQVKGGRGDRLSAATHSV